MIWLILEPDPDHSKGTLPLMMPVLLVAWGFFDCTMGKCQPNYEGLSGIEILEDPGEKVEELSVESYDPRTLPLPFCAVLSCLRFLPLIFTEDNLKSVLIHRLFLESTLIIFFCCITCRIHFRAWDHLRSNLGIICGSGSFAGLYSSLGIRNRISAKFLRNLELKSDDFFLQT